MEYSFNKPRNEFEKLLKRAIKGEAKAQFLVGDCYLRGDGVERDVNAALNWYRKSALQEYPEALCILGKFFDNGYGVAHNQREAVKWYRQAAEQGHNGARKILKELGY